jgi:hypothetical protein
VVAPFWMKLWKSFALAAFDGVGAMVSAGFVRYCRKGYVVV